MVKKNRITVLKEDRKMKKQILCAALCLVLVLSCFGCQAKKTEVDLREKLAALTVSDEALGLRGKYAALSDITEGAVDPALTGKWVTADGETSYTYNADGTEKVESGAYGDFEVKYTCLTCGERKVLCEELTMNSEDAEGNQTESKELAYTAYRVENDALYMMTVEGDPEDYGSFQAALVTMYRADKDGSPAAAMAKNPISLRSLDGTWTTEKGSFTIENGVLTCDGESGTLSFNDKNQLVVAKDGKSTAYSMNLTALKRYGEDEISESTVLGLYYTGEDEDDLPNLLHLMDDWKTDYGWDTWYYTGSFELQ